MALNWLYHDGRAQSITCVQCKYTIIQLNYHTSCLLGGSHLGGDTESGLFCMLCFQISLGFIDMQLNTN